MQQIFKKTILAASLSLAIAPAAYATNGMAPTGLGQVHKAMGGAAVGNPLNTTSMMTNPAAASFIADGYDVAGELFKPNRTATSSLPVGPGSPGGSVYEGDAASAFFIPEAAFKKDMGRYSFGVTAYGNGGMNTSYKPDSPVFPTGAPAPNNFAPFNAGDGNTTGVDLKQIFVSPTISTKLNDNHSVGLSLNLVAQQFHATGLLALSGFSGSPGDFTDRGTSTAYGVGATFGYMGKLNDNFTVGASYRMETKMGEFDEYKGLFPDAGVLDVPAALTIGASVNVTPSTIVAADLQQIYYSDSAAMGNSSTIPLPFGSPGGPGFSWDDQTIFKIGFKTQATPRLAVMAGYNHGASPLDSDDTFFGALVPGVTEDHLSLGFEYGLSKKSSLVGSYIHSFNKKVEGDATQPFDLDMDQDAIGLGYSRQF